jgi:uncharacterized DUF497 family protein
MQITFDPVKNAANMRKHAIDLCDVEAVLYDVKCVDS